MDAAVPEVASTPEDRAWGAEQRERGEPQADRRRAWRRTWRFDAWILAVAAVLLRLPMLFADRALVFDDGVFGASALAMRAGEVPFRGVFSSQGPLFLPLVWVADLVGFRTLDAPRLLTVASGLVLTVAVYACGRRLTSRGGALLGAGLVTTSGSVLWVTGPINADGPALALSIVAVACALRYRDDPRLLDAVLVGLAGGAALSIKFLAAPAVVVAGGVVLASHRRVAHAFIAASTAVVVYLAAALPFGLGRVWEQSYEYHADAVRQLSVGGALEKVVRTLWERDLAVVVALVLAGVVALLVLVGAARRAPLVTPHRLAPEAVGAAVWALLVLAVLLYEPALWRAHIAQLVVPLTLLAALRPPPWRVLLVAALVVVPVTVATRGDLWWRGPSSVDTRVVNALAALPSDALVVTDDPGLAWRADRRIPGELVDPSFQRIDNGDITQASVVRAASRPDVCAVVVTSPNHFGRFVGLGKQLEGEGYESRRQNDRIVAYTRPDCEP